MSVATVGCAGCGASLATAAAAPLTANCLSCGARAQVAPAVGGELRVAELGLPVLFRAGDWRRAVLERAEGRHVIVEVCAGCRGPLVVPAAHPLVLGCVHCGQQAELPLGEHVLDLLPIARIAGADMKLTWTPHHVQASVAASTPCPSCGAPLPEFVGRHPCLHCGVPLLAFTACGRRFIPGVLVEGLDGVRQVRAWWPLVAAIEHYRRRLELGEIGRRGIKRTLLVWLLLAAALPVLFCLMVGVVMAFASEIGPGGIMALFVLLMVAMMGVWGWALLKPIFETMKKRAEIRRLEAELAGSWTPRAQAYSAEAQEAPTVVPG